MEDKIKIGIIGAGENTRKFHIPNFQKLDGVEVVSVCNRSRESGQKVADEFTIQKVFSNWIDLVKDSDINAVCIGTWPYMHKTLVEAALNNGKHVMTEARMTDSYENAKDMLSQLKEVELDVVEYSKVDNTQYKINDKLEKRIKTLEQKVGK